MIVSYMQCRVCSSKEKIQPVPEFSYSSTGVFCLFLLSFFVYNFLQLYKDIRVLQGNLQPVNKTFWCHDISAQVRFISASFEIV